jgi:YbbR domain-containing protein
MAYHPFRHLGLKFLSVAVALGLWFTVAGEETVERSLHIPLQLRNYPERLELVENPPASVDVRVRGRSGLLSQLAPGDVLAMLDLSSAKAGRRFFNLSRSQVSAPFGVEVVEVSQGNIPLRFEPSSARRVPVMPIVEGEPAAGYLAGKPKVEPATVEVAGPEGALLRLKEVTTEPVSVAGARETVRERVALGLPDASIRLGSVVVATVTVPVAPRPVERVLSQVPVHLHNAAKGVSAQALPAAVAVTVRGPAETVAALRPDSISAFVDLAGLGPGRYNLSVLVEPGQGFVVVGTRPSAVGVRIK